VEPVDRKFFVLSQGVRVELTIDSLGYWRLKGDLARTSVEGDEILPTSRELFEVYHRYGIHNFDPSGDALDAIMARIEPWIAPLFRGRLGRFAEVLSLAAKTPWERTGRL